MKVKKIIIFTVAILLIFLALLFVNFRFTEIKIKENKGAELIVRIEEYRKQNSRLPNNVSELGLIEPMGDGPYYEKKDSLNYIVFFNIGFDNFKTYYSQTKEWKDEP